ncbi:MAG TPA: hypothetical protein VMM38_14625 [Aridibacter sp.]|nr:hypothetical protein [Aridibacter sp.]
MAERSDPWKQIGRPAYTGIHRMPYDLEKRAALHEFHRQRVVTKILTDLYCMVSKGFVKAHEPVSIGGAGEQSLRGSRSSDTQAAHCAPRQIFINARKMQDKLDATFPERGLAIAALFGETDILPSNFNRADSRVEGSGMAEALLEAAKTVVLQGSIGGTFDERAISMAARKAFAIYRQHSVRAFNSALRQLQDKVRELDRSRIKHSLRTREEKKWREQHEITQIYAKTLDDSPGLDEALEMDVLVGLVRIYSM